MREARSIFENVSALIKPMVYVPDVQSRVQDKRPGNREIGSYPIRINGAVSGSVICPTKSAKTAEQSSKHGAFSFCRTTRNKGLLDEKFANCQNDEPDLQKG